MRKIIATEFYTLDGMMSDPKDEMEWVLNTFNAEMGKYQNEIYDSADTLLLGRVTYKIFESYWPNAATNPLTPEEDLEMAHKINNIKKIVFSKNIEKTTWQNSRVLNEINLDEIAHMKREPGKNILIVGSASIVQQLTNIGLIDEYHLSLHPVVLGIGKPLFKDIKQRQNLKLLGSRDFGNGVILLKYSPIR